MEYSQLKGSVDTKSDVWIESSLVWQTVVLYWDGNNIFTLKTLCSMGGGRYLKLGVLNAQALATVCAACFF